MADGLELWGGPECTVNRVGDRFADQFERCGHDRRIGDLDLFADIGLTTVRYPVSWEKIAPDRPDRCDWRWIDPRLHRLRELGIDVVAGLVHHGSGPAYTDLLDDDGFASGLAAHARNVAERYPWIERWTPVNEPLTTARFSALYGHWYPHTRNERDFWRALLNQVDAVRLSIAAVRAVNPNAQLIQTEDLGRTFATFPVREQADFDNVRRWASWDLLCGRMTREHPLWQHIARLGLEARLGRIADNPCPPDVIGVNHYLTSDRFLDHRLDRYPGHPHSGNGRQFYVDVEAIRVLEPPPSGLEGALREAWHRYGIPIALTEVHNGCTREEQMRWLAEAWDTAVRLRGEGVDIRALTVWSLLGSSGWNTLLTAPGIYEPGVYDVRGGRPRATALANLIRGLATGAERHPVVRREGWWRRPMRLLHPPVANPAASAPPRDAAAIDPAPLLPTPLLIVGKGPLAAAVADACSRRNIVHLAIATADPLPIAALLDQARPWAVIDAAASAAHLLDAAAARDIPVLGFGAEPPSHGERHLTIDARSPDRNAIDQAIDLLIDGERGHWNVAGDCATASAPPVADVARAS